MPRWYILATIRGKAVTMRHSARNCQQALDLATSELFSLYSWGPEALDRNACMDAIYEVGQVSA